jgi:anti-sigma factor RsiW
VQAAPPVNQRRIEALRALVERGATEGEREAARTALAAALRGEPVEPPEPPEPPQTKRNRTARATVCRWIRVADGWAITGPEHLLRSGRVTVHARDRRPRDVQVDNVRSVDDRWIADEVQAPAQRPAQPGTPSFGRVNRPGRRPPPPYRRPDLLPEHYMQCWRLEDILEELAGADVLTAVKAGMQRTSCSDGQRRERLIAEIWRHQTRS